MAKKNPIWRLKYLPQKLAYVCGRGDIISQLKNMIKERNFPHLLLVGAKGIGKTTIARLFAKEFLGPYFDANFKIVYADVPLTSEERRKARTDAYVSTSKIGSTAGKRIRTPAFVSIKVKPFVELKVIADAPFKILVVKNFEQLEADQQGFRRLMETFGNNCRMILITTKISGIIDPIISRCQLFLISRAKFPAFRDLLNNIAQQEGLQLEASVLDVLYQYSEGQLGHAIDILQLCGTESKEVTMDTLYNITYGYQHSLMSSLLMMIFKKKDFSKARDLSRKILSNYKFNAHDFFTHLLEEVKKLPLSNFARSRLINKIADADMKAMEGLDDDIQISALISEFCLFSEYL